MFQEKPRDLNYKEWLLSFEGRLNRKQFWLFCLPYLLITNLTVFGSVWFGILNILALWPLFAVLVKRWHDIGKSGWWSLLVFVPIVGWLMVLLEAGVGKGRKMDNQYGKSLYKNV